jgi:hypothetical protein
MVKLPKLSALDPTFDRGTGCDHYRMPLAVPGVLALEVDGKDVSDKIHKHGAGPEIRKLESVSRNNKEQYNMCLWVAHPMGPGEHTLGLKCAPHPPLPVTAMPTYAHGIHITSAMKPRRVHDGPCRVCSRTG